MKFLIHLFALFASLSLIAQPLARVAIKAGPSLCGQHKTPSIPGDLDNTIWFSVAVEPTLFTSGAKEQFEVNTEISFIRKGGINTTHFLLYDQAGNIHESSFVMYRVGIDYLSFSPNLKWNLSKLFFIKAGPRIDAFLDFKIWDDYLPDPRTKSDFEPVTCGVTYGMGLTLGKKRTKFILEFLGQNDLTASSYNPTTGQTFVNYCFLLNAGLSFGLRKE